MGIHVDGPYQGYSDDGPRLFAKLDRLLAQPHGILQLLEEFGKRAVCDAVMSEEPPFNASTVSDFQASLDGFLADHPELKNRQFEFTMKILPGHEKFSRG